MRALVVEDDRHLSDILVHVLGRDGYEVDAVFDGEAGADYARSSIYDVVVLDVMLPKMSGFDAVRRMRGDGVDAPVLMLTARTAVADRIEGLDMGADNYMTKPFSPRELLARLRALTRRKAEPQDACVRSGDLTLDKATYVLGCGGEQVQLSYQECRVAELFLESPGRVFPRPEIARRAWDADAEVSDNGIDVYVSMLRKKLRYLRSEARLVAERGIGYRLVAAPSDADPESGGAGEERGC